MDFENSYFVHVKANDSGYITAVNSSEFLSDTTGWVKIDEGYGDKYHHAQGNYFPEPIMTDGGAYRYKLVEGTVVACTAEEITEQEMCTPTSTPTQEARIARLEEQNELLLQCVLEMSEIVYA